MPLGALYGHLPKSPFHTKLQKVRIYVDGLFVNEGESTTRMVAGLQILSRGYLGSVLVQDFGRK
jgi:hypothetical protein